MRRGLHKTLTWMLTASVVAGSLVPPAMCHSHDDGQQTHSHDASDCHHDHDGDHHHDDDADSSPDNGVEVAAAHIHWNLLGIEFSFPVRQDDESNGPQSGHDGQFGVVRLNDDVLPTLRVEMPETGEFLSVLDTTCVEMSHAMSLCGRRWECNSVCRSAHIERSGVLLI